MTSMTSLLLQLVNNLDPANKTSNLENSPAGQA